LKDKKKYYKLIFPFIVIISLIVATATICYKLGMNNNSNINSEVEIEDPSANIDAFYKSDLSIYFSDVQKIQIVHYSLEEVYMNQNLFKYFFISEFNKLGPNALDIHLNFKFDQEKAQTARVTYSYGEDLTNFVVWNFILKTI